MTDATVLHLSTLGKLLINKLHEIVSLLAELLHIQLMTDATVLHLSTLGKLLVNLWRSYYTFSS
jgi:hypothetical protein